MLHYILLAGHSLTETWTPDKKKVQHPIYNFSLNVAITCLLASLTLLDLQYQQGVPNCNAAPLNFRGPP